MMRALAVAAAAILSLIAVAVGLVAAGVGILLALSDANDRKRLAAKAASQALGRELVLDGDADLDLGWVTRLTLHDIRLANAAWADAPNMAQIGRVMVAVNVRELLGFDLVFPEIEIDRSNLLLEKNATGEPNWQFPGLAGQSADPDEPADIPVIRSLRVTDARLRYNDPTINRRAALDLARLTVDEDAADRGVRVSGRGTFERQPLSLQFRGGPWSQLRDGGAPYPLDLAARIADVQAKASGSIGDPAQLEGVDLKIDARGDDMAKLFPLLGVPLPPTPPYSISGRLRRAGSVWRMETMKGRLGDSDIAGTVAADSGGERLMVKADLTSERLVFDDLAPLIGARPGGEEGEAQKDAFVRPDGRLLPDKRLDLGRLKAMNADIAFNARRIEAEALPVDRLSAKLTLQDGVLRMQPANVGVGEGSVRVFMSLYGTREPVRTDVKVQISGVNLRRLLAGTDFAEESVGILRGRADLSATGTSVAEILGSATGNLAIVMTGGRISRLLIEAAGLDIAEGVAELFRADEGSFRIRCAVADWQAQQGMFEAKALVFDTTDTNVAGRGSINMREERIDLTFYPLSKDFSPLSLAQPLTVQGTFADPTAFTDPIEIGVEGTLKKVINAILTPIVGLLPPVDTGRGEDADCDSLIARAGNSR